MATTVVDTLSFARRLKDAGLPADQAEGMAAALGEEFTEHLLSKPDLLMVNAELSPLKWMLGFNLAFSVAILWRVFG